MVRPSINRSKASFRVMKLPAGERNVAAADHGPVALPSRARIRQVWFASNSMKQVGLIVTVLPLALPVLEQTVVPPPFLTSSSYDNAGAAAPAKIGRASCRGRGEV